MRGEAGEIHFVAGLDSGFGAEAAVHFEYVLRVALDGEQFVGVWLCVCDDSYHLARGVGENHVERDRCVVHPEISRRRIGKDKDHSRVVVEMLAKHQTHFALRTGDRDFDSDGGAGRAVGLDYRNAWTARASE